MIRISKHKKEPKTLVIRFEYNKEIIEKIKTIPGKHWHAKEKYWTIPYWTIQSFCKLFDQSQLIIEPDVDVNYVPSDKYNFEEEINYINSDKFKLFARWILKIAPEEFYIKPASSSGKYHPEYAKQEGGLAKHTAATIRIGVSLFDSIEIDPLSQDIIIVSLLAHDIMKYNGSDRTNFEHPLLASKYIEEQFDSNKEELEDDIKFVYNKYWNDYIKKAIESHMGRFNTKEGHATKLPLPKNKISAFVHQCDYLASRSFIEINFNKKVKPSNK